MHLSKLLDRVQVVLHFHINLILATILEGFVENPCTILHENVIYFIIVKQVATYSGSPN